MRNYNIAIIVVVVLLGAAGLGFVITGFATAGVIEYNYNTTYDPSSPDPIEALKFNADIGKIIVQYNSSATSHYADIDVDIKISGLFMAGKPYTNFFSPSAEWWDESSKTFTLAVLPDVWFDPSHWFSSYNINITVILRTDIVYDLYVSSSTGSVDMYIPENVELNRTYLISSTGSVSMEANNVTFDSHVILDTSTGSVYMEANDVIFNGQVGMSSSTGSSRIFATATEFMKGYNVETSTGSLTLNFTSCIMGDDIDGLVSTGSITYRSYNMVYTKSLNLNLDTSTGGINAYIYQYKNMNANITCDFATSTGGVGVLYRDTLTNTGVRFLSSTSTGSITYTDDSTMEVLGTVYQSLNYGLATQKYTFTLTTSTGSISADAESAQPAPP